MMNAPRHDHVDRQTDIQSLRAMQLSVFIPAARRQAALPNLDSPSLRVQPKDALGCAKSCIGIVVRISYWIGSVPTGPSISHAYAAWTGTCFRSFFPLGAASSTNAKRIASRAIARPREALLIHEGLDEDRFVAVP